MLHQDDANSPVFTEGTHLAAEFDELAPRAGEPVIWKKFPGAFAETDLQQQLGDSKKLVLTGYMVGGFAPGAIAAMWNADLRCCRRTFV